MCISMWIKPRIDLDFCIIYVEGGLTRAWWTREDPSEFTASYHTGQCIAIHWAVTRDGRAGMHASSLIIYGL